MSASKAIVLSAGGLLFGFEVVLYLCLGGLGGGLSAVAGAVGLSIPRKFMKGRWLSQYSNFMRSAFTIAAASLVLGSLLLLADSGNFPALPYLFFAPPFGCLSLGAWAVVVDIALCFLTVMLWGAQGADRSLVASRTLHGACALSGLAVALYAGIFLASMKAVPLWNTPLLPALFTLSSLSCGLVLFLALVQANDKTIVFLSSVRFLAKMDIAVVVFESFCAVALVLSSVVAPADGSAAAAGAVSALDLTTGEYAWIWWGGFVGLGLVATAAFDVLVIRTNGSTPGRTWSTLGTSFCVLIGAFSLRFCIVAAGLHPALGF